MLIYREEYHLLNLPNDDKILHLLYGDQIGKRNIVSISIKVRIFSIHTMKENSVFQSESIRCKFKCLFLLQCFTSGWNTWIIILVFSMKYLSFFILAFISILPHVSALQIEYQQAPKNTMNILPWQETLFPKQHIHVDF